jgi:hypothetical protein
MRFLRDRNVTLFNRIVRASHARASSVAAAEAPQRSAPSR